MVALMVIVAIALAWLGSGCRSTAMMPPLHDASSDAADASTGPSDSGDAPTADCDLPALYTFGYNGGDVAFTDESTLTPPASYRRTREHLGVPEPPPPLSCMPALPACGDTGQIDVSDIVRDFADPDVVQAMAMVTPPLYGLDQRPVDGAMFQILRDDGHGFLAGSSCDTGAFCHGPVPTGIARLVADLKALDQQQLGDPSCASLQP